MKIGFFIPHFQPQICGVSDYALRMASLLESETIACSILYEKSSSIENAGVIPCSSLENTDLESYDLISIQYTPEAWKNQIRLMIKFHKISRLKLIWMIHEFCYFGTTDHTLSWKQTLVSLRQRIRAYLFKLLVQPDYTATSNSYYAKLLRKSGIEAIVSPMPATIPPLSTQNCPIYLPKWLGKHKQGHLWVTFGALYTTYWNCLEALKKFSICEDTTGKKNYFIVCGKQSTEDKRNFLQAAEKTGCAERVFFTDHVSISEINWWFEEADASFTPTRFEFWEKSSGALAVAERGIPLYFLRGNVIPSSGIEFLPLFSDDPLKTLSCKRSQNTAAMSAHSGLHVARRFLEDFVHS